MTANTGSNYEEIVKQIFQQIINQDSVKTIEVKKNIILEGKAASHQIDVYWEFEIGSIKYITVVEAKDWNKSVDQGELLKFKGRLDDLPNQPRGIFVTQTGFQKGAREFAKKNGISLYELRRPTDKDWEGKIKDLIINLAAIIPHTTNIKLNHDSQWLNDEKEKLKLPEGEIIQIQLRGYIDEISFFDEQDKSICSLKKLIDGFYPAGFNELPPTLKIYNFSKSAFIHTGRSDFPRIKITSVEAIISVSKIAEEIRLEGDDFVSFILKEVFHKEQHSFDKNLMLRKHPKNSR